MKRKVTASLTLSCDFTDMLQQEDEDLGEELQGEELREYLWDNFADSLSDLMRGLNRDSIDIQINGITQP